MNAKKTRGVYFHFLAFGMLGGRETKKTKKEKAEGRGGS